MAPGSGSLENESKMRPLTVRVFCACADEDLTEDVMLILTSISDKFESQIHIYPNPTSGILHVDGNVNNSIYNVYDLNQRLVANGTVQSQKIKLNLVPGMYILQLRTEAELKVEKIIIK